MSAFISIFIPAVLKFAFLSFSVKILLPHLLGRPLPGPLVFAFTAPQFFTAFAGGILALGMMRIIKPQTFTR
jgi:hypothetical protein